MSLSRAIDSTDPQSWQSTRLGKVEWCYDIVYRGAEKMKERRCVLLLFLIVCKLFWFPAGCFQLLFFIRFVGVLSLDRFLHLQAASAAICFRVVLKYHLPVFSVEYIVPSRLLFLRSHSPLSLVRISSAATLLSCRNLGIPSRNGTHWAH